MYNTTTNLVSVLVVGDARGPPAGRELHQAGLDSLHLERHAGGVPAQAIRGGRGGRDS